MEPSAVPPANLKALAHKHGHWEVMVSLSFLWHHFRYSHLKRWLKDTVEIVKNLTILLAVTAGRVQQIKIAPKWFSSNVLSLMLHIAFSLQERNIFFFFHPKKEVLLSRFRFAGLEDFLRLLAAAKTCAEYIVLVGSSSILASPT